MRDREPPSQTTGQTKQQLCFLMVVAPPALAQWSTVSTVGLWAREMDIRKMWSLVQYFTGKQAATTTTKKSTIQFRCEALDEHAFSRYGCFNLHRAMKTKSICRAFLPLNG